MIKTLTPSQSLDKKFIDKHIILPKIVKHQTLLIENAKQFMPDC